jgi:predicted RNase H-like HicB family nuclease
MKLHIVLEPSEDGGYTVYVPSLPGCISEGDTVEESLSNIKEAIHLYLAEVDDDILPQPEGAILKQAQLDVEDFLKLL